jgi:hypothetical protein
MNRSTKTTQFQFSAVLLTCLLLSLACSASNLDPQQGTAVAETIQALQAGTQNSDTLATAVAGTLTAADQTPALPEGTSSDISTPTPAAQSTEAPELTPTAPIESVTWPAPRQGAIDFNGDGFEDLAVGVVGLDGDDDTSSGGFYEFHGGPESIGAGRVRLWTAKDLAPLSPNPAHALGFAMTAGDFDGDGFSDLAVGFSPKPEALAGAVFVLYGSSSGLDPARAEIWDQGQYVSAAGSGPGAIGVNDPSDGFGSTLSTGDFNQDGLADLVIGVHNADSSDQSNSGAVNVLYGTPLGLSPNYGQLITQNHFIESVNGIEQQQGDLIGTDEVDDFFGLGLTCGDFNGDGVDDLAIGAPTESFGEFSAAGAVHIIYGSPEGLTAVNNVQIAQDGIHQDTDGDGIPETSNPEGLIGSLESRVYLGIGLAAGDFNNDGRDDLAIGAPGQDLEFNNQEQSGAGVVHVLYGSTLGLRPYGKQQVWNQTFGQESEGAFLDGILRGSQPEELDFFGYTLASGDFDADGYEDLVVAAPGESLADFKLAGSISVIYGSESGLAAAKSQSINQHAMDSGSGSDRPLLSSPNNSENLGQAMHVADINRDGVLDLIVSASLDDVRSAGPAGAMFIIFGVQDLGLTATDHQRWTEFGGENTHGATYMIMPALAAEHNQFGFSLP